ncbi:hypothetical protein CHS0354_017180 [Potamilus streckersoni]|uniref:Uncharacterized protein n=1 Tax=Potamilus streckersoni TaxID=2493646 RepID=A0AAE0T2Q5_9BIVA|nr:hypothetical protein CHS0354_017180 [Potamilus streckersoni]
MTDFKNFIFIVFFVLSIFSYLVFNIYILSFLFVLGITLFVSYRGYMRKVLPGTWKQDRRNGMNQNRIEKMSGGRTTIGGHQLSPKRHNTYPVSPNTSSRTPLTPLHKSPWSNSSVLNDQFNDSSMIGKKRSTWTSGKTTLSFLHSESNGSPWSSSVNQSPWSNSVNQSHQINDKSDVASSALPAFLPMIKRALGLEHLPEPNYSSPRRQAIVPIPNTGLSPGVYPNFRMRKLEKLSLSERNTSMYRKTNTVKIAPPDPNRTLSPYLSRLKADSSMTEKSTPDTRAVVTALKERRKRSMNAQEETVPDVPVHHAKRRRQESQHSNASTSSLPSLHEALPDLSQHNYNIPRLETSTLKRPSRPSQEQNEDYESELSVKRPRQQTRNNAVWSSLSSSRKMVERREISGKDVAKRKLDLTEATDKENTETLSKLQRMDTVKLSFAKEQSKMKGDRDSTESPDSSLNGSRGSQGVESELSRPSMLKNLSSSKKSSLSIYSEMNTRPRKVPYANVRATLEDYDKDKEAEYKRVQQMLQDVDKAFKEKSAADKVKSVYATTVTSSFTTAPVSTTTTYVPTSLNSFLSLKSTPQVLTTSSEPTTTVSLAAVATTSTVAPVPSVSLTLPNGEIPKTPPKEVIPQQESGEGNKAINVTVPSCAFPGFISSNQTTQNSGETWTPVYSSSVQISLKTQGSQESTSSVTAAANPGFSFAAGTTGMAVTSSSQPQFSFKPVLPLSATATTASSGFAEGFNFKFSGGSGSTASNSSGFNYTAGTTAAPSLKFSTINTNSNPAPILSTTESLPLMQKSSFVPGLGTGFNFAANSSAPLSATGGLNFTQPTSSVPASAGFNFNVNKTTASTVGGFTFSTNTTTSSTAFGSFSFATNKTTSGANSGFVFSTNKTDSNAIGGFNFTPNSTASNTGISFKLSPNTSVPSAASVFQSGNSLNLGQTNTSLNFPSSTTSSGFAPIFNTGTFSFSSNTQTNAAVSTTGTKFGAISGTTDQKSGVGFNFSADAGKISFVTGHIGGTTSPFGQSGTVTQQGTNAFGQNATTSQQSSNLFGQNTTTNQQTSNLFEQNTTANQKITSPFGQSGTTNQPVVNLFGQSTPANQQKLNLFGQTGPTSQQTSNMFGQSGTANQQNPNIFGLSASSNQQTSNPFGQSGSTFGTSQASSAPFVFGQGGSSQTDVGASKGFNFSASAVATPQFNFNANSSFGTPGFGSPPSNPFSTGSNVFSVGSSSTAPRPRSVLKGKRRTTKK